MLGVYAVATQQQWYGQGVLFLVAGGDDLADTVAFGLSSGKARIWPEGFVQQLLQ